MINIISNGCCSKGGRKCCFYTYEQDDHQPEIGLLKSAIVRDNKNKKQYIYDSLGVYTEIQGAGDEYVTEEELYDLLNKSVVSDIDIYGDDSTLTVEKVTENLYTGAVQTTETPLPVASETEAGVMNSATFSSVKENSENIDAILGGAVALSGIPASPTQAELTQVWKTATDRDELVNRAQIYDQDNQKVWTYYSNSATWYPASNTSQVTVSQWTNTSAGIAKGSTTTGQVFAEADGTGSVNGWDALNSAVSTNTTNITNLSNNKVDKESGKGLSTNDFTNAYKQQVDDNTTAITGKQDALTAGDHIDITDNVISAEGYVYADDPTTATVQPSVTTSMLQDGAVTADKISEFRVGDSFRFGSYDVLPGHVTNSSKDCIATVNLPFRAVNNGGATFSITYDALTIRGVSGYLAQNGTSSDYNVAAVASSGAYSGNYHIRLTVTKKDGSAFSGATNNTPITVIVDNCVITRTA